MKTNTTDIAAAVLAAGMGKRIGHHLPKVLYPIIGKPMLYYTLELLEKIPLHNVNVVVGARAIDVKASLRNKPVKYVYQEKQLGTAHAVGLVLKELAPEIKHLIVFNGDDSAFFEVGTIRKFIETHLSSGSKVSFISCRVDNPKGLGRVVRNESGTLTKIVEEKEASENEKQITEVNVGCYVLDVEWVRQAIDGIKLSTSGEYYITDLVSAALLQNEKVNVFELANNLEWRGVNTQDELKDASYRMTVKLIKTKKPTVFIFDIDNTLIDTDKVKNYVNESLVKNTIGSENLDAFWREYERIRNDFGYISIPDLADSFAEITRNQNYSESVRNMFYTIPFDKFVYDGVYELIEYLDPKGEIALVSEGDLVYQPMKIKNLRISKFIDEMYVFEDKKANIDTIAKIYDARKVFAVDDKITDIEAFKTAIKSATVIHFKQGVYKDLKPIGPDFEPDFTVENISDLSDYIKSLY